MATATVAPSSIAAENGALTEAQRDVLLTRFYDQGKKSAIQAGNVVTRHVKAASREVVKVLGSPYRLAALGATVALATEGGYRAAVRTAGKVLNFARGAVSTVVRGVWWVAKQVGRLVRGIVGIFSKRAADKLTEWGQKADAYVQMGLAMGPHLVPALVDQATQPEVAKKVTTTAAVVAGAQVANIVTSGAVASGVGAVAPPLVSVIVNPIVGFAVIGAALVGSLIGKLINRQNVDVVKASQVNHIETDAGYTAWFIPVNDVTYMLRVGPTGTTYIIDRIEDDEGNVADEVGYIHPQVLEAMTTAVDQYRAMQRDQATQQPSKAKEARNATKAGQADGKSAKAS